MGLYYYNENTATTVYTDHRIIIQYSKLCINNAEKIRNSKGDAAAIEYIDKQIDGIEVAIKKDTNQIEKISKMKTGELMLKSGGECAVNILLYGFMGLTYPSKYSKADLQKSISNAKEVLTKIKAYRKTLKPVKESVLLDW